MAASTTLSFVLLSAFLFCAFVPYASATSVNITRPAYVAFRDVNTCMEAAIAIVKNTDCNPQVACSSDRTIYLTSCSTTNYELLGFNATYYLDYQYNTNYVAQGISIYYSSTQLLWTFATSDDLLNFYSAAIYNSTCNTNVNKTSLSLVMTTPTNGYSCTFATSTLLPFDSFKSGTGILSNSAAGADSEFASAL
jgi:hypothetical protein